MTAPSQSLVSVRCADLSFTWPDGSPVLDGLTTAFGPGVTGLVGVNGSGKSTLLRLIAGELVPTSGRVEVAGSVASLPQQLTLDVHRTVADLLGVRARLDALRAVEAGGTDPELFAVVGDDWDVEQRALETLDRLGVLSGETGALDRPVGTLSGGEAVLAGVAGVLLRRAGVSLLDEPTNNLDGRARELLYDAIATWPGVLVVVSHDRELLELVDTVADLQDSTVRLFGGTFGEYEQLLQVERAAAERDVRDARAGFAREKRQWIEAQVKLDRRARTARRAEQERRVPKIIAHGRRGEAQVSAAKHKIMMTGRLDDARARLTAARDALPDDARIAVDLPGTAVPAGRTVLRLTGTGSGTGAASGGSGGVPAGGPEQFTLRGPERVRLAGDNGSGKTTLLEAVVAGRATPAVRPDPVPVPFGYLRQRLDGLDPAASVLDNVRAAAPTRPPQQVRAQLARFLLRGAAVERDAGTLSGGERFRVALACLLLADPAPQLLLLDEPTSNLDLRSVAELVDALAGYRGALLVVSHDPAFVAALGVTRTWTVEGGVLAESRA